MSPTANMTFVQLNFEGQSVEDLVRIRQNCYAEPDNEYCVQLIQIITNKLRDMEEDIESDTESEATESECESDTESECE